MVCIFVSILVSVIFCFSNLNNFNLDFSMNIDMFSLSLEISQNVRLDYRSQVQMRYTKLLGHGQRTPPFFKKCRIECHTAIFFWNSHQSEWGWGVLSASQEFKDSFNTLKKSHDSLNLRLLIWIQHKITTRTLKQVETQGKVDRFTGMKVRKTLYMSVCILMDPRHNSL